MNRLCVPGCMAHTVLGGGLAPSLYLMIDDAVGRV